MGLTIGYSFLVKNNETAEKIVQETQKTAERLDKMFGGVETHVISPKEIIVDVPGSDPVHLNFSTIKEKKEGCKPSNAYDPISIVKCQEARNLHHTYYVTSDGTRYNERRKWEPHEFPVRNHTDWEKPIFGTNKGLQTKNYTKTHYGGPHAHMLVCELLEPAKKHAFLQRVRDEGDFCGTAQKDIRDIKKIEENFKTYWWL